MARMTREESQALTRAKLISVAQTLFTRDGYAATSLDQIAETAGVSKGAVYSNFDGKEELFLEVLEEHGRLSLSGILAVVNSAHSIGEAIERIAQWSEKSSRKGNWPTLILEYSRQAKPTASFRKSQEKVLRAQWRALGEQLLKLDDTAAKKELAPETVGALIFELTYAPAMSFVSQPTSGDLLRVALRGVFRSANS